MGTDSFFPPTPHASDQTSDPSSNSPSRALPAHLGGVTVIVLWVMLLFKIALWYLLLFFTISPKGLQLQPAGVPHHW